MSYTYQTIDTDYSGDTLYLKPMPLDSSAWGSDVIPFVESENTGSFSADVDEPITYAIYSQSGDEPAATDQSVGVIAANNNASVLAAIAEIETTSELAADTFMTALIARLSGEIPALTSGYQPQTQTLKLIEGADYAVGSIPGPLDIPLPDNAQYEDGDDVWLHRTLGYSKVVQPQWIGEIFVVDGSAVARFVDVSPSASGIGTWELWHKNNDGKRWMPTSGKLNVMAAIQTISAD